MLAFGYLLFGIDAAEFGGEVAQAVVGENGDDHADVGITMGYFDGGSDITAGGDAAEDAFFTGQAAGHFEGFIGGGGNDSIEVFDAQHLWYKTIADAFDLMRSPRAAGEDVALSTRSEHKLCAIGTNGLFALVAHSFRHDDDNMVAFGGTDTRGGDTGVAGGAFDDAHTWAEIIAPLGL